MSGATRLLRKRANINYSSSNTRNQQNKPDDPPKSVGNSNQTIETCFVKTEIGNSPTKKLNRKQTVTKGNVKKQTIKSTGAEDVDNGEATRKKCLATKHEQLKAEKEKLTSSGISPKTKQAIEESSNNIEKNENVTNDLSADNIEFVALTNVPMTPLNIENITLPSCSPENMLPEDHLPQNTISNEPTASSSVVNHLRPIEVRNILNHDDNYEDMYGLVIEDDGEEDLDNADLGDNSRRSVSSHICNYCNIVYTSPMELLRHKRNAHKYPRILVPSEELKSYFDIKDKTKCPICTKPIKTGDSFPSQCKWAYIRHLKTHSDERKFECPKCKRKFKRLDHMKEHAERHY